MFPDAIQLMEAADRDRAIENLAKFAGTRGQPSMSLLMSARAALFKEGWKRTANGYAMPKMFKYVWDTQKDQFLEGSNRLYRETAVGRTSDETKLIMCCRIRTMMLPHVEQNRRLGVI